MVPMRSARSARMPPAVICDGSALRKSRFPRVRDGNGGVVVKYPPIERKLWIPSTATNGGEGTVAIFFFFFFGLVRAKIREWEGGG